MVRARLHEAFTILGIPLALPTSKHVYSIP